VIEPGSQPSGGTRQQVVLALAWLLGFCVLFFFVTSSLPNNSEFTRVGLVAMSPATWLDALDPPHERTGWRYFPQRFGIWLSAAGMVLGAWGIGRLVRRFLSRWDATGGDDVPGRRTTDLVLSVGLGLAVLSLLTLGCGLVGLLERRLLVGIPLAAVLTECVLLWRSRTLTPPGRRVGGAPMDDAGCVVTYPTAVRVVIAAVALLFLFFQFGGAALPSIDFDVKEYHLQGPREFFEQGRITRLPHNVYTSFPFLTEMLSLAGMVVADDWWWGALVGKCVLASFAPLTALALYAVVARWWSRSAGLAAGMVYLTIPWTTRVSIIAYTEGGLCFFLAATLLAVALACQRVADGRRGVGAWCTAGVLAGSGMACKYTGLVQVVVPAAAALVVSLFVMPRTEVNRHLKRLPMVTSFAIGLLLAIGPWLLKNLAETGNPVYPLAYSIFGVDDWDDADHIKWKAAHSSTDYSVTDLAGRLLDVTSRNDWHSPLVFGLAPLAVLVAPGRRRVVWLWLLVVYLFLTWWGLTHRLDRFFVPMLPVVSLLAGIGMTWSRRVAWWRPCAVVVVIGLCHNVGVITVTVPRSVIGYNAFLVDLDAARLATTSTAPAISAVNDTWGSQVTDTTQRVLCVGEAQVFDARFPVHYNTVFDESLFEAWCGNGQGGLADAESIASRLREQNVGWILVNWQEILRYRTTYGYTEFVTPERFELLRKMGLIGDDLFARQFLMPIEPLADTSQHELATWGSRLKETVQRDGRPISGYVGIQLFRVR